MNKSDLGKACPDCGGLVVRLEDDWYDCRKCLDDVYRYIASKTVPQHLWNALVAFHDFRFKASLGALGWAGERLFRIGDYKPVTGRLYVKGYPI